MVIRAELSEPGHAGRRRQGRYNELFTMHGSIMLFLFLGPFAFGLANYLVPLQIGARDMAFPRLNALSLLVLPVRRAHDARRLPHRRRRRRLRLDRLHARCRDVIRSPGRGRRPVAAWRSCSPACRACSPRSTSSPPSSAMRAPGMTMFRHADLHLEHARDERARAHRLPGADQRRRRCCSPTATSAPTSSTPAARRRRRSCGSTCSGSSATPRCTSSCCRTSA